MNKHVSNVYTAGFYRLRQLRRVRRSLDTESAATIVHAFVTSHIDYCNVIVGWGTEGYNWQATASFECCSTFSQWYEEVWSWTVPGYACRPKLVTTNCLHGKAPSYLTDCCTPISDVASRRHLRSASRRQLLVARHNLSTYGRRAFSVAGPAAWNCLSDELREPLLTANSFGQLLTRKHS